MTEHKQSSPSRPSVPSPQVQPNSRFTTLVPQIRPDRTLQLRRTVTERAGKVLNVVPCGDAEATDEVFGGGLEVAVLLLDLVVGAAKVGVRGDGAGALEALKTGLGLGLLVGVEGTLAEVLVGGDALLGAELAASEVGVVWKLRR